jgi:flagella basal body P-ring formation protein FlgA
MIPLAVLAIATCVPVEAPQDQITAADLERAIPGWSAADPAAPVAFAPVPGVVRIMREAELRRAAQRLGSGAEPAGDTCFQRPVAPIAPARMLEAMRQQLPAARIEILEASRASAPAGPVEFPLSGLRPGYWSGYVRFGAGHKFAIWARIRASWTVRRVVAADDLRVGEPVSAAQLRLEDREEFPAAAPTDASVRLEDFAGLAPRRAIAAGTALLKGWRGDHVKVEVVSGAARLEAEAIAEASGTLGDMIPVQNPDTKRRYRARVESAGRVSVKGTL